MTSDPVVETVNIILQVLRCLLAAPVTPTVHTFSLQGTEETLHRGVIPAVALTAHAWDNLSLLQAPLIFVAGVLGEFKWSSQRWLVGTPLPGFSNPGLYEVDCSRFVTRP